MPKLLLLKNFIEMNYQNLACVAVEAQTVISWLKFAFYTGTLRTVKIIFHVGTLSILHLFDSKFLWIGLSLMEHHSFLRK